MANQNQDSYIDCDNGVLKPGVFYLNPKDGNLLLIGEEKGKLTIEESFFPRGFEYHGKNSVYVRGILQPIKDPKVYISLHRNQANWLESKLEQLARSENKLPLSKINPVAGCLLTLYPIRG